MNWDIKICKYLKTERSRQREEKVGPEWDWGIEQTLRRTVWLNSNGEGG